MVTLIRKLWGFSRDFFCHETLEKREILITVSRISRNYVNCNLLTEFEEWITSLSFALSNSKNVRFFANCCLGENSQEMSQAESTHHLVLQFAINDKTIYVYL